jgi:hypothetical protein
MSLYIVLEAKYVRNWKNEAREWTHYPVRNKKIVKYCEYRPCSRDVSPAPASHASPPRPAPPLPPPALSDATLVPNQIILSRQENSSGSFYNFLTSRIIIVYYFDRFYYHIFFTVFFKRTDQLYIALFSLSLRSNIRQSVARELLLRSPARRQHL